MTKIDLLTGEEFKAKRINQNFATPQNRIKYYNNKATEFRRSIAYINKPLKINAILLNQLMAGKKSRIFHKEFLLGKGFDFSVHTHVAEYKGKRYYAVYNYIIATQENNQINVIRYD